VQLVVLLLNRTGGPISNSRGRRISVPKSRQRANAEPNLPLNGKPPEHSRLLARLSVAMWPYPAASVRSSFRPPEMIYDLTTPYLPQWPRLVTHQFAGD
jgi:hypothetical protein